MVSLFQLKNKVIDTLKLVSNFFNRRIYCVNLKKLMTAKKILKLVQVIFLCPLE